jgi:hypothetical protein
MRAIVTVCVIAVAALASWGVASVLSPDAIGMAVGLLFGVLAGIPTALLIMANSNRRRRDPDDYEPREPPAPVVVLYSNRTTNNTIWMSPDEVEEEIWMAPRPAQLTTRR